MAVARHGDSWSVIEEENMFLHLRVPPQSRSFQRSPKNRVHHEHLSRDKHASQRAALAVDLDKWGLSVRRTGAAV